VGGFPSAPAAPRQSAEPKRLHSASLTSCVTRHHTACTLRPAMRRTLDTILVHIQTLDLGKGPLENVLSIPNLKFSLDETNPHRWRCSKGRSRTFQCWNMEIGNVDHNAASQSEASAALPFSFPFSNIGGYRSFPLLFRNKDADGSDSC
jgi:hypothetical protein